MKFRLDRKSYITIHRREGTRRRVILIILIIAVLYFGGFLFGRFLTPLSRLVAYPFVQAGDYVSVNFPKIYNFFSFQGNLATENEELKSELDKARVRLLRLDELTRDNVQLRSRLGYNLNGRSPLVAKVISKPDQSPYDIIILDLGSSAAPRAPQPGDLVTYENTVALGTVEGVSQAMTTIRLFSSPGVTTPVLIGDRRIPAIAEGLGGGSFKILLPHDVVVSEGETIHSTSTAGYLLGKLGRVVTESGQPFQEILWRSPVNFLTLKWVEIYAR